MLTILINESDAMFRQGMTYLLSDFFRREFGQQSEFITDYTPDNIAAADVIVLSLYNGERYTCFPELRARRKGIIIGLVDENSCRSISPSCFEDILFIGRKESLTEIMRKLAVAWNTWSNREFFPKFTSCFGCKHRTLSLHQQVIMDWYYAGHTILQIADKLNVNPKTVASHKYFVMRKFNLRNDYDIFRFLDRMHEKKLFGVSVR